MKDMILKHIPIIENYSNKKGNNIGLVVDTETTGLEKNDEIFELTILPFMFDDDLNICEVKKSITKYQYPKKAMSQEALDITGIDLDSIKGETFDKSALNTLLKKAEVVLSHNAPFDRHFIEKDLGTPDLTWGCSMTDIDWKAKHFNARVLDYIAFRLGYWFDAHKSSYDCLATLHILSSKIESEKTIFQEIMDKIYEPASTITINGTKFSDNTALKELGCRWNPNEKNWIKTDVSDIVSFQEKLNSSVPQNSITEVPNNPLHRFKNSYRN